MVGGGEGAFIGQVHRIAAELDGEAELVCGAFASNPERSRRSGQSLYRLHADRCYDNYEALFQLEANRADAMDFVVIATPNHTHYSIARAALEGGFHVVCDKPLAMSVLEGEQLQNVVKASGLKFALTHNYTGYPMVREARSLVNSGVLGKIRRVSCEYLQGWLHERAPDDNKQAAWRTDPARSGAAGCFGDIGSHAENLTRFITGLEIESLAADLTAFVPGRLLDDDGNVLLRFKGGAKGVISASQIAVGKENDLSIQVYGETGGLEWRQSDANSLIVRWPDKPYEVRRTGWAGTSPESQAASRIPPGHPEGYLEGFAELYRNFYKDLSDDGGDYPNLDDGIAGMRFIESVVESTKQNSAWVDLAS
ncbi:MAG: gfo/Idh/MocA family oxidoreductase [Pseudomonadales bacterium]|nr:gfo/Idh/MocA family oxidoreductase [Pseudomonadales bacterium]